MKSKTIVVGNEKYSGQGYFYMAIKDSYELDEIRVKSNKYNWDTAEIVIHLLMLNGWQESDISRFKENETRSRCQGCNRNFKGQVSKCDKCGTSCKEYHFTNKIAVLHKIGALEAHQESTLRTEQCKEVLKYLDVNKSKQNYKDRLILERWE